MSISATIHLFQYFGFSPRGAFALKKAKDKQTDRLKDRRQDTQVD